MALTYGFYNSSNGDRKYSAEDFGRLFDGIIRDGIFLSIGNHFQVTANGGLSVSVGTGRAWFDHTWTYNSSGYVLTHDVNNTLLDRIDAVVLEVNHDANTRENSIKIVKGSTTSTVRPTLVNTDTIKQYPLAYVLVAKQASSITQGNITNMIGTSACPFVSGLMETIDAESLYSQWASQFSSFLTASDDTFDNFMSTSDTTFTEWFNNLEAVFSETEYQAIMNRVASVANVRQGTFLASDWTQTSSSSGIYSQTINVTGMSADYNPILVGLIPDTATVESATSYNQNFARLVQGRGTTAAGSVTWYCYGSAPEIDLMVGFKGE